MDVLSSFFKFYLIYYLISNYGLIFGGFLFYLSTIVYRLLVKLSFNLDKVNNLDIFFIGRTNREKFNLMGVFFFDDFNEEKMKDLLIEKGISKIKKFRMKLIYKFYGYFWKEVELEDAIKRIKIIENHNINSEGDMMNYLEDEVNSHIDIMKDLPYEFQLIKYKDNSGKGAMVVKLDHTFSDGLGIISATLFLADNFCEEIFPPIMRKGADLPWYQFLLNIITFPYYGPIVFYKLLFSYSPSTPLRISKKTCGKSNFILSKTFELNSFAEIRKRWKVSFNDIIMCVLSRAINRFVNKQEHNGLYKNLKEIKCAMPIGRKAVPLNSDMIKLNNEVNMIYYKLPLINDIEKDYKIVVKQTSKYLKNPCYSSAVVTLANLLAEFMPMRIISLCLDTYMDNVDLIISNVPGPMSPLYFAGSRLTKLIPITSNSRSRVFLPVLSYDKKFNLLLTIDSDSGIDKKEFMRIIEEEVVALTKN